jgi:hypothetical protein
MPDFFAHPDQNCHATQENPEALNQGRSEIEIMHQAEKNQTCSADIDEKECNALS